MDSCAEGDWFLHLVSSLYSLSWKKNVLLESCVSRNNTPFDLIQFCLFFVITEPHWSDICEWKYVIVNLLGGVYQAVKMMTLPGNKNQKKIRRRRRKEKTLLTQVMFWGWTLTVSKGTDFEALLKLLHLLVVMLYSVLVNSQCNLHHYENIVLKDSHKYIYNIKIITWPYF